MDIQTYLTRIQYVKPVRPDAQTLQGLHLAHMQNVPFENLDIGLKRPIRLTEEAKAAMYSMVDFTESDYGGFGSGSGASVPLEEYDARY